MTTAFTATTGDLILHHYDGSPFSEKVRLMLGFKGLAWKSVKVPVIMPKPDVTALTGGYRRTPILQVGADIYCDSALIAQVLEQRAPTPTLFPAAAPLAPLLAQWADSTLFWTVIPYTMQPAGLAEVFKGVPPEVIKAFAADRAPFSASVRRQTPADATVHLEGYAGMLDAQLQAAAASGGRYLFGAEASIADLAVAHCCWYVRRGGSLAQIIRRRAHLDAWLDRMLAVGHGNGQPMASDDAVAVAAGGPRADMQVQPGLGFEAGQTVSVAATDYGMDAVAGTLVGLSPDTVVLSRTDARAGQVHVHFPRHGFQIKAEKT